MIASGDAAGQVHSRRIEWGIVLLILLVQGTFFHRPEWNQNARLAAAVAFVEPDTLYTGTFIALGQQDSAP